MDAVPTSKSKKRKAASEVVEQQKKAKRSLGETDEQWQKYIKNKTTVAVPVSAATTATATTKPNNKSTTTTTTTKKKTKTKTDPLTKHREACDLMINDERERALTSKVEVIEDMNADNCEQRALAINVMPERGRQTAQTLALGAEHKGIHIVYNDVDFCMEMKRRNYERSAAAAKKGVDTSCPLQELMGDQGFFSNNKEHVEQVLACINKDMGNDVAYSKQCHAETVARNASSKKVACVPSDTANKKLNLISGGIYYSYGYHRRTPQLQSNKIKSQDMIDRERRFNEFYKYDQLETETDFGEVADNFKMLREMKRHNLEKFTRRNETLRLTASLTPKTDIELVSREYVANFRQPPVVGEEVCANREQCVFNTFSSDKNVCYIGKVFYTEHERKHSDDGGNTHRLCYDCLIAKWTIEWALNIQHEIVPERPINYFCVMCKPGQYSPHCMLSVTENDKPTGIVGFVPRFSHNNRRIVTHVRHIKRDGKYHQISVPVLDETGMDF